MRYASGKVQNAIKKGILVRKPCVRCGAIKALAHHEDYSKPLDVMWLCINCHHERHKELRKVGGAKNRDLGGSHRLNLFLRQPQRLWLEAKAEHIGIGMAELIRRLINDARQKAEIAARVKALEGSK